MTVADRDYFGKLQYVWHYGPGSERYAHLAAKATAVSRDGALAGDTGAIFGWIGTVKRPSDLVDGQDNFNKITILVRGKMAQEDILEEFNEGRLYSKYIIGEIQADFLDVNDQDDIATTSRQRIVEDDPRYEALRAKALEEIRFIGLQWTALRNAEGLKEAEEIPAIREWLDSLGKDQKKRAESLFGKINQLAVESDLEKRYLFSHAVLAFENLRYKDNLDALEDVSSQNIDAVISVLREVDEVEATLYYKIVKGRLEMINLLRKSVDENARERVLKEHLFNHLWLIDTSWERATGTEHMEKAVAKVFDGVYKTLTKEERDGRIDLRYASAYGKHVTVELKRAGVTTSTAALLSQISKYRSALIKYLLSTGVEHPYVEFACVVGKDLSDWSYPDGRSLSVQQLRPLHARVVQYDELTNNANASYRENLNQSEKVGRLTNLIERIEREATEQIVDG